MAEVSDDLWGLASEALDLAVDCFAAGESNPIVLFVDGSGQRHMVDVKDAQGNVTPPAHCTGEAAMRVRGCLLAAGVILGSLIGGLVVLDNWMYSFGHPPRRPHEHHYFTLAEAIAVFLSSVAGGALVGWLTGLAFRGKNGDRKGKTRTSVDASE